MVSLIDAFYAYSLTNEQSVRRVSSDVTMQEAYLLVHLYNLKQPRTPSQLQDYFLHSPSNISNLLRRCEDKGWILKTIHPTLHKSKWVILTEEGTTLAQRIYEEIASTTLPMLSIFNSKQKLFLKQMLKIYITLIRGTLLEFQESDWQLMDIFVYYYYQLYFAIEWAMVTKNEIPITLKESRILQAIATLTKDGHGPTIQETASDAKIVLAECSQMVNKLVKRGVLEKLSDPNDSRIVRLATTTETKEKISNFIAYQGQWVDDRVMKPKLQELVSFFITMRKFTKYYQKHPVVLS